VCTHLFLIKAKFLMYSCPSCTKWLLNIPSLVINSHCSCNSTLISHSIESNSTDLVMFSSRLATMLFIASKGFTSRVFVTQPSLAVRALPCLTRDPAAGSPRPNTFLPVLSGGNADSIFLTISTRACSQFTIV